MAKPNYIHTVTTHSNSTRKITCWLTAYIWVYTDAARPIGPSTLHAYRTTWRRVTSWQQTCSRAHFLTSYEYSSVYGFSLYKNAPFQSLVFSNVESISVYSQYKNPMNHFVATSRITRRLSQNHGITYGKVHDTCTTSLHNITEC